MRGEGVLASTWWFGRCALTGSPECRKGPNRGWKKMCIRIYIYILHAEETPALSLELCYTLSIVHNKACIQMVT
jgi:hypothetical protein